MNTRSKEQANTAAVVGSSRSSTRSQTLSAVSPLTPNEGSKRTAGEAELSSSDKLKRQRIVTAKALALQQEGASRRRKSANDAIQTPQPVAAGVKDCSFVNSGSSQTLADHTHSGEISNVQLPMSKSESPMCTMESPTPTPPGRSRPVLTTRAVATPSRVQSFNTIAVEESQYDNADDFQYHRVVSSPAIPAEDDESAMIPRPSLSAGPRQQQAIPEDAEVVSISSSPANSPPPEERRRASNGTTAVTSVSPGSKQNNANAAPASAGRVPRKSRDAFAQALAQVRGKPELCRTGITQDFYHRILSKKYNDVLVPKLNETLSYLLWKNKAAKVGTLKEEPFREYFEDKTASLEKKMTFLIDNVATFCQQNRRTVTFKSWEKNGRFKFNGIPVLARDAENWTPLTQTTTETRPKPSPKPRPRHRFPCGAANPRSRAALEKAQKRVATPGSLPTNPIVLEDSGETDSLSTSSESFSMTPKPALSTRSHVASKPARSPSSAAPAVPTAVPQHDAAAKGYIFVEAFHKLCKHLKIPPPHNDAQIRSKGYTAQTLAREFTKMFPHFDSRRTENGDLLTHPAQVLYEYAEKILSVHMKSTEKPKHPNQYTVKKKLQQTTAPRNATVPATKNAAVPVTSAEASYPTPSATEDEGSGTQSAGIQTPVSEEDVDDSDLYSVPSRGPRDRGVVRPTLNGMLDPAAASEESLPGFSNKAPRKGNRNIFSELGDVKLYEMRQAWQQAAWKSDKPVSFISEARTDPLKRETLQRQKKIKELDDRQKCINSELKLLDREQRESEEEYKNQLERMKSRTRSETASSETGAEYKAILDEQKANDDEFLQRKIRLMEDGAATAKELEDLQKEHQEAEAAMDEDKDIQENGGLHMFIPGKVRTDAELDGVYRTLMLWGQLPEEGEPRSPVLQPKKKKPVRKRMRW